MEEKLARRRARAVERMREQANRLRESALEELNRPRLENTARRVRIAKGIELEARRNIQLADSILNIAAAIEGHEVEFVNNFYTRAHFEQMERLLWRARGLACIHEYKTNSANYRWERDRDLQESDIRFADFPYPSIPRSLLESIADQFAEEDGFIMICKWLNKQLRKYKPDENMLQFTGEYELEQLRKLADKLKGYWRNRPNYLSQYTVERFEMAFDDLDRLYRMDIFTPHEVRAALREYWQYRGESIETPLVKTLIRKIVGYDIPGFHPTPPQVGMQQVHLLDVKAGMSVCEPSGGKGDLIDCLGQVIDLERIDLTIYEIDSRLCEIMQAKGYHPTQANFLETTGRQFNRILANPIFDNGQDMAHVRHMYSRLAPEGKLVTQMSEGTFTRSDNRTVEFREWLKQIGAQDAKLPEDTYLNSDRPTSTRVRMVVIEK